MWQPRKKESERKGIEHLYNGCGDERRSKWDKEKLLHESGSGIREIQRFLGKNVKEKVWN